MNDLILIGILIVSVLAFICIIYIAIRLTKLRISEDSLKNTLSVCLSEKSDMFKGTFLSSLKDIKLEETIGIVKQRADDILSASQMLQDLFKVKRGRSQFGEFQLEELLKDSLPKEKFGIREDISEIGTPDAHIKTREGIICIDSKFPLENYQRMVENPIESEKSKYAKVFRKDVEKHIEDIATKYVKLDKGTVPFAFCFIPSEAVYQYLTECESGLLKDAATRGVNLVSPATFLINLNLIKIGIRAKDISEKAVEIEKNLQGLRSAFETFEKDWEILRGHIIDSSKKLSDVDTKYSELRKKYDGISKIEI